GPWQTPYPSLPGWPTVKATFFGTTTVGTIIPAPRSRRCRDGVGRRSITRTKSTEWLNVSRSHLQPANRGRTPFHYAAKLVNTDGFFPVRFQFSMQRAKLRAGLGLTRISPNNGNWRRHCARAGTSWNKR